LIRYVVTYLATLAVFLALDAVWISLFAAPLYRSTLTVAMVVTPRIAPIFIFYFLYIIGIMVFVIPKEEGWQTFQQTFLFGALFGLFAYATFDLTSLAIIQAWTSWLAFTDILWGVVLTGTAAAVGDWIGGVLMRNVFTLR
jgi:uncharacterized membrane protein